MNSLHLRFILECDGEDKSDAIYLRHVLKRFYVFENDSYSQVSSDTLFMEGKRNYKGMTARIRNEDKALGGMDVQTVTFYMIDLDSEDQEFQPGSLNRNIADYCSSHGYELIWMCKNVENVFLGIEADAVTNKTEAAKSFVRDKMSEVIDQYRLSADTPKKYYSNILRILDKYLKRK